MSEPDDVSAKVEPETVEPETVEPETVVPETVVPDATARSARWPWLRSAVYSLMVFLSPAVWVIDTTSCAEEGVEAETTTRTGVELARGMGVVGVPDTIVFVGLIVLMIAAPWLAWRARTPLARVGFHILGLLLALFGMMCSGFLVFFTLFHIREVQPVGYLVLLLSFVPVIESFARIALGVTEARAQRPARAGPPSAA
jgi:hypothetical protein